MMNFFVRGMPFLVQQKENSPTDAIVLLVVLLLLFLGGVFFYKMGLASEKAREKEFHQYAQAKGYQFSKIDLWKLPSRFKKSQLFSCLKLGLKIKNVIHGKETIDSTQYFFRFFDCESLVQSKVLYRVCAFEIPYKLPYLYIFPEPSLSEGGISFNPDRIYCTPFTEIGEKSVQFESHEFNKSYYVHGENRKFVFDFLNAQMIEFFLEEKPSFMIEIGPSYMLVYYGIKERKKPGQVEEIEECLSAGRGILKNIAPFIKEKYSKVDPKKS